MSRDVYFRRVWKPDPLLNNQINEGEVGYDTPYRAFRLEKAEEWMKDVSQVVRIKRRGGALLHPKLFVRCHLDYVVFYAWNAYFRFGGNNDVVRIFIIDVVDVLLLSSQASQLSKSTVHI